MLVRSSLLFLGVLAICGAQIIQFDTHAIERIFQDREPTLFLFSDGKQKSQQAKQILAQLDREDIGVLLSISEAGDENGMFKRLTGFFEIKPEYPQFLFISETLEKYLYPLNKQANANALAQFVQKAKNDQIQPNIKSAPVPETNEQPVKVVVASNFKKTILKSTKEFLVLFHAPWCEHCTNMLPAYEQAAAIMLPNLNVGFAKIDVTDNQVNDIEIDGLPTLLFFPKDRSKGPVIYTGGREAGEIIDWLRRHVHYEWVEVDESALAESQAEL